MKIKFGNHNNKIKEKKRKQHLSLGRTSNGKRRGNEKGESLQIIIITEEPRKQNVLTETLLLLLLAVNEIMRKYSCKENNYS